MVLPEFVEKRLKKWEELYNNKENKINENDALDIKITLPDGSIKDGKSGITTPMIIAKSISNSLAKQAIVARVDGILYDMGRPLLNNCKLEILKYDDPDAKRVFAHSSAHTLGAALEELYGVKLCIGPPLDDGTFYYDSHSNMTINEENFDNIEKTMKSLVNGKYDFERLELSKDEALELFANNPFKIRLIKSKVPDGELCTAYRCGHLIDLCRGPHVPNTGIVKAFSIMKASAAYWLGDASNESLSRVYGAAFPNDKLLKAYKKKIQMAKERDHRKIGMVQNLFRFNETSPGSCFFLPHGTRIYNKLIELMRNEYRKRGFTEVITPNVFNVSLWKTSGHYHNYKENMFLFDVEKEEFGMKPMNCPGHCIMFGMNTHSYRELPIRFADFGVLHRNEYSGALSGLTRVRRFQQDDAHIFCTQNQIEKEVRGALEFLESIYSKFGFTFKFALSTRPKKFLGQIHEWDLAEEALAKALTDCGHEWVLNPADGAFYGPKIDVQLFDAMDRSHQCATIQLDFQLPQRFGLKYKDDDGKFKKPVIIHRAILGSVERMIAILTENFGGKWPLWLSPRQVMIVPLHEDQFQYAEELCQQLQNNGYWADADLSSEQFKKKVRIAHLAQYNYILVVGKTEMEAKTVNVRLRSKKIIGEMSVDELIIRLNDEVANFQ